MKKYIFALVAGLFIVPVAAFANGTNEGETPADKNTLSGKATFEVKHVETIRVSSSIIPKETLVIFDGDVIVTQSDASDGVVLPMMNHVQDAEGFFSLVKLDIDQDGVAQTFALKELAQEYKIHVLKKQRVINGYTCQGYAIRLKGAAIFYEIWLTKEIAANYSPIPVDLDGFAVEYSKYTRHGKQTVSLKEITFTEVSTEQAEIINSFEKTYRETLIGKYNQ